MTTGGGHGPNLASIIWRSIPDNSARFAELQAGTIQQADLAQTDLPLAAADPNLQLLRAAFAQHGLHCLPAMHRAV